MDYLINILTSLNNTDILTHSIIIFMMIAILTFIVNYKNQYHLIVSMVLVLIAFLMLSINILLLQDKQDERIVRGPVVSMEDKQLIIGSDDNKKIYEVHKKAYHSYQLDKGDNVAVRLIDGKVYNVLSINGHNVGMPLETYHMVYIVMLLMFLLTTVNVITTYVFKNNTTISIIATGMVSLHVIFLISVPFINTPELDTREIHVDGKIVDTRQSDILVKDDNTKITHVIHDQKSVMPEDSQTFKGNINLSTHKVVH